jgi:hypothetical protein
MEGLGINDFTKVKSLENFAHESARYTPSYAISFEGAVDSPYHFSWVSTDFGKSAGPEGLWQGAGAGTQPCRTEELGQSLPSI